MRPRPRHLRPSLRSHKPRPQNQAVKRTLSPQDIKQLERIAQAGVEAYLARDYQSALHYAEQWLQVQPDNTAPRRDVAHAKARILFGRGAAAEARGDMADGRRSLCRGPQGLSARFHGARRLPIGRLECAATSALRLARGQRDFFSQSVGAASRQPPHFHRHIACAEKSYVQPAQQPAAQAPLPAPSTPPAPGGGLSFATGDLSAPAGQKDWAGLGIYELESSIEFDVLDWVYFDPATNQLVLVGHRDPRFAGRRIPYLDHLAGMLEHPRAEMTLAWAPDLRARRRCLPQAHGQSRRARQAGAGGRHALGWQRTG